MIFAIIILLIIIFAGVKLQYSHYVKAYKSGFLESLGKIVDYKKTRDSNRTLYSSIVEFYANGKSYRTVQKSASNLKQKLGKEVAVMYNPLDPTDSVLKRDNSGLLLIIVALLFLIVIVLAA